MDYSKVRTCKAMENLQEQLALRDRMRRHLSAQKSPSQRLHEMAWRQRLAWNLLRRSPEGYARFLRRNFKARAIDVPTETTPNGA
jgi:hypothetical protein